MSYITEFADPASRFRPKEKPWYDTDFSAETISEPARKLLEEYSGIPHDQVLDHVKALRDRAWELFPFPCIGMGRFLDLSILTSPNYDEIAARLKGGQKLLDLGCCLGQEIRQLSFAGVPSENLYGSDLLQGFIDLGYDLFRDKDRLHAKFFAADVFDPESDLKQLDAQMDVIYTGSFFHLFSWDEQFKIAKRVVRLLKPVPDSLLVGRQVGNVNAREYERRSGRGSRYRHNEESWGRLWKEVGEETGTKWKVAVRSESWVDGFAREGRSEPSGMQPEGTTRMKFTVRRL